MVVTFAQARELQRAADKAKRLVELADELAARKRAEFARKRQQRRRRTEAALVIQAASRGHLVRSRLRNQRSAAVDIQRWYRFASHCRRAVNRVQTPAVELLTAAANQVVVMHHDPTVQAEALKRAAVTIQVSARPIPTPLHTPPRAHRAVCCRIRRYSLHYMPVNATREDV